MNRRVIWTVNPQVPGSSPGRGARFRIKHLAIHRGGFLLFWGPIWGRNTESPCVGIILFNKKFIKFTKGYFVGMVWSEVDTDKLTPPLSDKVSPC